MVEGSSFGEIGLIHRCPRTADVIAKNYITLARIKLEQFQILIDQVDVRMAWSHSNIRPGDFMEWILIIFRSGSRPNHEQNLDKIWAEPL